MKKMQDEALEREPLAVGASILEMKSVKKEAVKSARLARMREDLAGKKTVAKKAKETAKVPKEPMQLKIKKTHSLGDFYGKFHPSKSTKGIKRSE